MIKSLRFAISAPLLAACFGLGGLWTLGCSPKPALKSGDLVFPSSASEVNEIRIHQALPGSETPWSARFKKQSSGKPGGLSEWSVVSAPHGNPVTDAYANQAIIRHLLETLSTLKVSDPLDERKNDPDAASVGLDPPRTRLVMNDWELRLGDRSDRGVYVWVSQFKTGFPNADTTRHLVLAEGALLRLLDDPESLGKFQTWRHPTVSPLGVQDVFRTRLADDPKTERLRAGNRFTTTRDEPLPEPYFEALKHLLDLPAQETLDLSGPRETALKRDRDRLKLARHNPVGGIFRYAVAPRKGAWVSFTLDTRAQLAFTDARPDALFRIGADAAERFNAVQRQTAKETAKAAAQRP